MHKILIIDDEECKDELNKFLQEHQDNILLLMEGQEFNERMERTIKELKRLNKLQHKVIVKTPEGVQKIAVSDILFIRRSPEKDYTFLVNKENKEFMARSSLEEVHKELVGFDFVRVNEDYILNMDYMSKYVSGNEQYILMNDDKKIRVEAGREEKLIELLNNWK